MDKLVDNYLNAKIKEEQAKLLRLEAEQKLIDGIGNHQPEGSKSLASNRYKVTVSNKLDRKLDHDKYLTIKDTLPEKLQFVKYKPEINLTALRHLEAVDPSLVAMCITTKFAKPSISIKEV